MQVKIDARAGLKDVTRRLTAMQRRQVPFAAAQALTSVARMVQAGEKEALPSLFDRPTPFTLNSVAVTPARKTDLTAVVYYKDIAAEYLIPFEDGGVHSLGSKVGMLTPIGQATNQYGNLPRNKIAQLLAKPNVFVGPVTFKSSGQTVNGVWQRNPVARGRRRGDDARDRQMGPYGTKGKHSKVAGARTTLKLLIQFDDPKPVTTRLGFERRAVSTVRKELGPAFAKALAQALATAR